MWIAVLRNSLSVGLFDAVKEVSPTGCSFKKITYLCGPKSKAGYDEGRIGRYDRETDRC